MVVVVVAVVVVVVVVAAAAAPPPPPLGAFAATMATEMVAMVPATKPAAAALASATAAPCVARSNFVRKNFLATQWQGGGKKIGATGSLGGVWGM